MKRSRILAATVATAALVALAGCSSSSGGSDGTTIKVAFQDFGSDIMANFMTKAKADFEKANPGKKITLVPIKAAENDYYTKLSLMNRAATTAPDVMSEDTFLIRADAQAGYLAPLDSVRRQMVGLVELLRQRQGRGQGRRRQGLRHPDRHRHPGPLVQQGHLREGRHPDPVAAEDLG